MKKSEILSSLELDKNLNLKNITRIGSDRVASGWWVRANRDGFKISKTFSDKDYDNNPAKSLQESIRLRNVQKTKKTISNTGYDHISISIQKKKRGGEEKSYPILKVNFKGKEKSFSISPYGYLFALTQCIEFLKESDDKKLNFKNHKLQLDEGLTHLNKTLKFDDYSKILEKTLIHKSTYGEYFINKIPKKKTILILADKNSTVISKDTSFTYSDYVKEVLKDIRKGGFDFQIENFDYKHNKNDYYSVYHITNEVSSKEFCFRVKKLIKFSKEEHHKVLKTASFLKTINKDNPTVKKELIDIIPDFQEIDMFVNYLKNEKMKHENEKKELIRKKNANLDNEDYAKRKDKQIGFVTKVICDYDRLLRFSHKISKNKGNS